MNCVELVSIDVSENNRF